MSNLSAISIRNLSKKIHDKKIVEGLTFDIQKGQVFGLLGPNGAGKTTTIRMMVGLMSITEGQVLINGIDIAQDFEGAMRHIGAIVENPEMYKFLTGYQNLIHFARMQKGVPKQRIDEVVELVGLGNRIHEKVKTYSLGMRQRLGLAQALLHHPSVLILDEPTNGLDPAGIRELRDHLRRLAATEGLAVVVSSHLLSEMELMCDTVAILQQGRLVSVKPVREQTETEAQDQAHPVQFEIDRPEEALHYLTAQGFTAVLHDHVLELSLTREQIPTLTQQLVQAGFGIYGIRTVMKTLEETFLEMTGGGPIA